MSQAGVANAADSQADPGGRRFVVCGDNPLAYRLVDELITRYDGEVTVIVASGGNWAARLARLRQLTMIIADRLDADAFRRAGLAGAGAVALVGQDDVANVDAALIAHEINPDVRIVIRMYNVGLGEKVARLLSNCAVVSAAAIAAPAFVAAALGDATTPPFTVADRTLVATRRDCVGAEDVVCGLAVTAGRGPLTLPAAGQDADLVLALSPSSLRRRGRQRRHPVRALSLLVGARLRLVLIALILLLLAGTAVLAWVKRVSLAQAAYIAFLTELGGADADPAAPGPEKLTLAVLSIVSIALIPLLTAAVVDAVVKARLALAAGGLAEPIADHIVVVGLGGVGTRVIRALHEQGHEIVCVERDPEARGIKVANELGIPVIIGDGSHTEVLQTAAVQTARALLIVSSDDVANLEAALLGQSARPGLRVVLRLFDGDFADRVQRAFPISGSHSVSYLAAPAFAAAMLGRQIITTIPVRRRVLLIAELPIGEGSPLDGAAPSSVHLPADIRLLAIRPGPDQAALWTLPPGRRLASTDRIIVVATRAGLGRLMAQTTPGQPQAGVEPGQPVPQQQVGRSGPDPDGQLVGSGSSDGPDG